MENLSVYFQSHQNIELIVTIIGSLGILAAFFWLITKKRKPQSRVLRSDTTIAQSLKKAPAPSRWWEALSKTRDRFVLKLSGVNAEALRDSLEEACITSDLGVQNTSEALESLDWSKLRAATENERSTEAKAQLASLFNTWLASSKNADLNQWPEKLSSPTVIWFVGVNGVGKTTSIAKLAAEIKKRGQSVLLAAGDTFRAAASEQLETWASRMGIDCIKAAPGADSSALLFDAINAAKARQVDFLLCDSAGRLHNQHQLMQALEKNKRSMSKALPGAPHEILLVLDAHTGQNMLSQAEHFLQAVGVTGLILTKLDGSARGGAVVAVARKTGVPIRRLGLGESTEDFVPFNSEEFSKALLGLN